MSVKDIAADLVALCKAGKFEEASAKYHGDDIVSIEAMGPPGQDLAARGKKAVEAKSAWWYDNHKVERYEVSGPFINADQFAVTFVLDVTEKKTGTKHHLSEVALYTVRNDKIVEERFFYGV